MQHNKSIVYTVSMKIKCPSKSFTMASTWWERESWAEVGYHPVCRVRLYLDGLGVYGVVMEGLCLEGLHRVAIKITDLAELKERDRKTKHFLGAPKCCNNGNGSDKDKAPMPFASSSRPRPSHGPGSLSIDAFEEVKIIKAFHLDHPNVINILDVWTEEQEIHLAMTYCMASVDDFVNLSSAGCPLSEGLPEALCRRSPYLCTQLMAILALVRMCSRCVCMYVNLRRLGGSAAL